MCSEWSSSRALSLPSSLSLLILRSKILVFGVNLNTFDVFLTILFVSNDAMKDEGETNINDEVKEDPIKIESSR